jgi:hypothetical protein
MPLREELRHIGERMVHFLDAGGDPPFVVYPYQPSAEWEVRRDLAELGRWFEALPRPVHCAQLSLAHLFWEALEESGFLDELIAQERRSGGNPATMAMLAEAVGEVLRQPPTLPDRVVAELDQLGERSAVVLHRAAALYPAYRTSTLLDDLRGRLARPVLLAYPGKLVGEYGLSFMGLSEPTYGYRALIEPREASPC